MFRRLFLWLNSVFGESLAALLFSGIVVILVAYRPIHEAVMLRYYYTPEEIRRVDLRVVEIVGKRDIIFSNGEHRPYETGLKVVFVGTACGLVLAWLALGFWTLTRLSRRSVANRPSEDLSGRPTAEPGAAPDPAHDTNSGHS